MTGSSAVAAGTPVALTVLVWRQIPRAAIAAAVLAGAAMTAGVLRSRRR